MILISDIHGCYNTLLRLLAKCPADEVVFLGDLIDRGPDSAGVVRYAMENGIPTVAGNHEDMLLQAVALASGEGAEWFRNGGYECLKSFGGREIPEDVVEWMKGLPLFLKFDDELLASHTGHGLRADREKALWTRSTIFPDDGLFRVFGHTPGKEVQRGARAWCIDTGAAYGHCGYGKLTALQWPSLRVFEQVYDERPVRVTVGVAS